MVGAISCSVVQNHAWLTVWRGQHLDLLPAETTKSGPKYFRNGLFRCEAGGEAVYAAGTERDLRRREGALEEPFTGDVDSAPKFIEFDSVNSSTNNASHCPIWGDHLAPGEGARDAHGVAPSAARQSPSKASTLSRPKPAPRLISAVADADTQVSSPAGNPLSCATKCSTRPRPR